MYCQKCGTQLDADAQFCKKCGAATNGVASQEDLQPKRNPISHAEQKEKSKRLIVLGFVALPFLAISLWSIIALATDANTQFFRSLRFNGAVALLVILSLVAIAFAIFCIIKKTLRIWWPALAGFCMCIVVVVSMLGPLNKRESQRYYSGGSIYYQLNQLDQWKEFRTKDNLATAVLATSVSAGVYLTIYNLTMAKSKKETS